MWPRSVEIDLNGYSEDKVIDDFNRTATKYYVIKVESIGNQMLCDSYSSTKDKMINLISWYMQKVSMLCNLYRKKDL